MGQAVLAGQKRRGEMDAGGMRDGIVTLPSLQAGGRQREADLVVEELERAQQRVAEMEAERAHAMQKKRQEEEGAAAPDDGGSPAEGAPDPTTEGRP